MFAAAETISQLSGLDSGKKETRRKKTNVISRKIWPSRAVVLSNRGVVDWLDCLVSGGSRVTL
jgi:hypothetical protein